MNTVVGIDNILHIINVYDYGRGNYSGIQNAVRARYQHPPVYSDLRKNLQKKIV